MNSTYFDHDDDQTDRISIQISQRITKKNYLTNDFFPIAILDSPSTTPTTKQDERR